MDDSPEQVLTLLYAIGCSQLDRELAPGKRPHRCCPECNSMLRPRCVFEGVLLGGVGQQSAMCLAIT